jgi:hypothetical protein
MQLPMTEVIGVRRFWWEGEPDRELLVMIGKPTQPPDHDGEFYCPIQTSGFGNDGRTEAIFGCDALQAIELGMRYIEHRLGDIDAKSGGRLRWQFGDDQRLPPEWAL